MPSVTLSYVISTRNKLEFLREVLVRLIAERQADEEVIVVDGASTDGTCDYLRRLHAEGQIDRFVSAPDRGEAHGYNKGLLMANGELIKPLSDDDAFYWPGIRACRDFMREHSEVDVLGTSGAGTNWEAPDPFVRAGDIYEDRYQKWKAQSTPFEFSGLGLMLRRSSLPLVGLLHTGFTWVDYEFSLRMTASPVNLAWYTGYNWVRISNPKSNAAVYHQRVRQDKERLEWLYLGRAPRRIGMARRVAGRLRQAAAQMKHTFFKKALNPAAIAAVTWPTDWPSIFRRCDTWLADQNERQPGEFLWREAAA